MWWFYKYLLTVFVIGLAFEVLLGYLAFHSR
jgi:hypothetical protein